MRTLEKLKELQGYFLLTRGIGHTQAMLNGARNTPDALILVPREEIGKMLQHEVPRAKFVSINNPHALRGNRQPLLLDNSTMLEILSDAIRAISDLEKQVAELKEHRQDARA